MSKSSVLTAPVVKTNRLWASSLRPVGVALRKRREAEGISLRAAARRGECSNGWLSQLETGQVTIGATKLDSVVLILRAYDMQRDELFDLVGLR